MAEKRIPLDPTGMRVAENVKRLRGSMQYKELSERLEAAGRAIPTLGLRRIEAGERRVDVDDLMALAVVFGVSPLTLLLPSDGSRHLWSRMTGATRDVAHNVQWLWALGEEPLELESGQIHGQPNRHEDELVRYRLRAKPSIDKRGVVLDDHAAEQLTGAGTEEQARHFLERYAKAQGFHVPGDALGPEQLGNELTNE